MANLSRIAYIDDIIRTRGYVTKKEVAEEFEVHPDTVKRDIEYMKLFIKAPIEYSTAKKGYIYSTPFKNILSTSEDAILYYIFIHKMTESIKLNNAPYVPLISKEILNKISGYITNDYEKIFNSITYDSSDIDTLNLQNFRYLVKSLNRELVLKIKYRNACGETSERDIEPLKLMNYLGKWYVAAYCHKRKELATFLISRFISSEITEIPFSNTVSRINVENYINGAFGMFKSKTLENAVIRIYEPKYFYVENQKWHKDQTVTSKTTENGKKYLEITLPIGDRYDEIIARVMAYAPDSEIISPKPLKDKWIEIIKTMYEKYGKE